MINLKLESWSAIAPGIDDKSGWERWFSNADENAALAAIPPKLVQISPLLRRRFTTLGKYAAHAALEQMSAEQKLPAVYASRHGDTPLTLSLLQDMGRKTPLSPTSFSLAVHNAVGGLLSIARKDASPMTAIASSTGLVLSTLHEAAAQLESYNKVLCVIYDVPLPHLYTNYAESLPFPLALAFIVSRGDAPGITLQLEQALSIEEPHIDHGAHDTLDFIAFLLGLEPQLNFCAWTLVRSANV